MHHRSYWKTIAISASIGVLTLFAMLSMTMVRLPRALLVLMLLIAAVLFAVCILVALGGLVCLWRDAREARGQADPFVLAANRPRPGSVLSALGLGFLRGRKLYAGDVVRVRSLQEIESTLDDARTLDGLPFMGEMEAFCGKTFRVHRRIDKINDMRNKTGLRRMDDTVTLADVRCSGSHHGGCQAECQILWKEAWLKRTPGRASGFLAPASESLPQVFDDRTYVCQMTGLWGASHPMSVADIRQDLRPILAGNLTVVAYVLAILTRLFNRAQRVRGGAGYPYMPDSPTRGRSPSEDLQLAPREAVVIRSREEIAKTLVNGRNRGLWFDRDMSRFCGQSAIVRRRIDHIIHEATGKMVVLKTPCVTLEGVVATGEFLRFCPQHEYILWRETWLRRADQSQ